MSLIQQIIISNFMCYREEISIDFSQGTFLIGTNNSGKSAILKAIQIFFDEKFSQNHLNRTEYQGKGSGFNKSFIQLTFDLNQVIQRELKKRLISKYGISISIRKEFIFKVKSATVSIVYYLNGKKTEPDDVEDDVRKLLNSVKVSYIHPQEGRELFEVAQRKLRDRLLSKWGQHKEMAQTITEIQKQWDDLKMKAEKYLSSMLSTSLQKVWSGCEANIELPKSINDIIAVSDISFRRSRIDSPIPLTSQGTGAQVSVLYQTHFILDSDRSLHQGEYHPLFLLEEPESFLHADVLVKQAIELSSIDWLNNIQLFVTTHSPLFLAKSRQNMNFINWTLLENSNVSISKKLNEWTENDIKQIGIFLGDPNFEVYFYSSAKEKMFFLEDKKELTRKLFVDNGINVVKGLNGTPEVRKYIEVLVDNSSLLSSESFFLADKDNGFDKDLKHLIHGKKVTKYNYFDLYSLSKNVKLLLTKENKTVEDFFDEWVQYVNDCYEKLYKDDHIELSKIEDYLTPVYVELRRKTDLDKDGVISRIKNNDEVKRYFWGLVEKNNYQYKKEIIEELNRILSPSTTLEKK